jgi:hypothetical protein
MFSMRAGLTLAAVMVTAAGCVYVPLGAIPQLPTTQLATAGKATLSLLPAVIDGGYVTEVPEGEARGYRIQAVVPSYTRESIHHVTLRLYRVNGAQEVPVIDPLGNDIVREVAGSALDAPIVFGGLHTGIAYRVKALAYPAAGSTDADVINVAASSSLEVTLTREDGPTEKPLPLPLLTVPFDGQATPSTVVIVDGQYDTEPEGAR